MIIGGLDFNPLSFDELTEDFFKRQYRGKLLYGSLDEAWNEILKLKTKKEETIKIKSPKLKK